MKLNKKQKRTATIASMAALLAVVLGMGGQTFAKYITTETTKAQTATVAKWGLVTNLQADDQNIFLNAYDKDASDQTVVGLNSAKVVAPGTSGSYTYTVSGVAEVDAQVTFTFSAYTPVSLTAANNFGYYPIVWTYQLNDGEEKRIGSTEADLVYKNTNGKETGFKVTEQYEANGQANISLTINWKWDFYTSDVNDGYDTLLGYASNGSREGYTITDTTIQKAGTDTTLYNYNKTVSYNLQAVIEQVD